MRDEQRGHVDARADWDQRRNDEARLAHGEEVHVGGVTLIEAFTPSTVSRLKKAPSWSRRDTKLLEDLERSRSPISGRGFATLNVIRRTNHARFPGERSEPTLPASVLAVWRTIYYLTPSVTVVCATFTYEDTAADLSEILRTDYHTELHGTRITVHGRLGALRSRWPWSRPKYHGMSSTVVDAAAVKARAVERHITDLEAECATWFYARYKGRFAAAKPDSRPVIRLIFTRDAVPFDAGRNDWRESAGLYWSSGVYRSAECLGWALKTSRWPARDRPNTWTAAARRGDVGHEGRDDRQGQSNWSLTQRFGTEQCRLAAVLAVLALLDVYGGRLAGLRDAAGRAGIKRLPQRDARDLDRYLSADGLDAATITSDVSRWTKSLRHFRWDVPEYTEDLGPHAEQRRREPLELVPELRTELRYKARLLGDDTANVIGNITASAELRQAITNTRLQVLVVAFTIAAVVIAIVSLKHG
jgi:hypothetical protein